MKLANTKQDAQRPVSGHHSSHVSGVRLNGFAVLKKQRAPDVGQCVRTLARLRSSPATISTS